MNSLTFAARARARTAPAAPLPSPRPADAIAGTADSPGLYFLGLSWQYTRGSALIGWVGDDAGYIADQIKSFRTSRAERAAGEAVAIR
jgi:hypothetical protein